MEVDFTNPLAESMVEDDPTLPDRLRRQKVRLEKLECTDFNRIGKFLEVYNFEALIEIFRSTDSYFTKNFRGAKPADWAARQAFIKEIQEHGRTCPRCELKIHFDRQWERHVENSISIHRKSLGKTTDSTQELSEAEHCVEMAG